MFSEPAVRSIAELLDRRFGLDALWVYGSRATNAERADSDLDLAALFRTSPPTAQLWTMRGELESLASLPVDIVDLQTASPILAMQVLRSGQVFCNCNLDVFSGERAGLASVPRRCHAARERLVSRLVRPRARAVPHQELQRGN
jgi:predicted nucleotidyltransferase